MNGCKWITIVLDKLGRGAIAFAASMASCTPNHLSSKDSGL